MTSYCANSCPPRILDYGFTLDVGPLQLYMVKGFEVIANLEWP